MGARAWEVRRQILAEHTDLRHGLDRVERLAHQVVVGERPLVGMLRLEAETLLKTLLEHIGWEDRNLTPALRRSGDDGEVWAVQMHHDHREQREMLEHVLRSLEDQARPAVLLGRNLADLTALLREDMAREEASLLGDDVLRDDY